MAEFLITFFENAKITEILDQSLSKPQITFLGVKDNEAFVLQFTKKNYALTSIEDFVNRTLKKDLINSQECFKNAQQTFQNDIYNKFSFNDEQNSETEIVLIYPANSRVVDKYKKVEYEIFTETIEIYEKTIEPYIKNLPKSNFQWIFNALEGKTEKIIYESKEKAFIIVRDFKFAEAETFEYCLGLPFNDQISSLRDLNQSHLNLLEAFYYEGVRIKFFNIFLEKRFGRLLWSK